MEREKVVALARISVRLEVLGRKLSRCRIPAEFIGEIASIQRAVDAVREGIEADEARKPS